MSEVDNKKEPRTIILNGTKMWFTFILFVLLHGSTGIWWASSINTRMMHIERRVEKVEDQVTKMSTAVNQLLVELKAQEIIRRSS